MFFRETLLPSRQVARAKTSKGKLKPSRQAARAKTSRGKLKPNRQAARAKTSRGKLKPSHQVAQAKTSRGKLKPSRQAARAKTSRGKLKPSHQVAQAKTSKGTLVPSHQEAQEHISKHLDSTNILSLETLYLLREVARQSNVTSLWPTPLYQHSIQLKFKRANRSWAAGQHLPDLTVASGQITAFLLDWTCTSYVLASHSGSDRDQFLGRSFTRCKQQSKVLRHLNRFYLMSFCVSKKQVEQMRKLQAQ